VPGVFGITGSGIGTLGAKAGACESLAVGPGAQAVNCSLAMGPCVCTTKTCSIAIGSCNIACVRIGCWDFQNEYKTSTQNFQDLQNCMQLVNPTF